MLRIPVRSRVGLEKSLVRMKSSSSFIRSTFIDYFVHNHGHKHIKSSSVVPLCDPSVPFVNAGMNQFKGVFLGRVEPPCLRAVNSQKCVRVGGKHNDLEVVGSDRHHHTFFEMLGNWSFGDYHKKEACKMAWDLLLGPYRFKPEDLVVTYFEGDPIIGIMEDRECRDIWKALGVQPSRLKALGTADNFWEMGTTGPCGPCTEIHYVNPDGSLTEIWNIVFIQCNREADGSVKPLRKHHVDTGMGLERTTALIQGAKSNYDTDLFQPLMNAIEQNSPGGPRYTGQFGAAQLDNAFRRLADHARMLAVCLADGAFPNTNLNLKQVMRTSLKIATDIFGNHRLVRILYDEVASTLGHAYPELHSRAKDAKLIIEHEEQAYKRLRSELVKKWRDLLSQHPEAEAMSDVEMAGFPRGYKEFKEVMAKQNSSVIPGELVFKLYDTHGFQEDVIERIAKLNNVTIDKQGFWKLLQQHKTRHKTAIQEQTASRAQMFDKAIENLRKDNITSTEDSYKYKYSIVENKIQFEPLKSKVVAILNEEGQWIDFLEPSDNQAYYLITKDTNFYCEEGGQIADSGVIHINKKVYLKVDSVFKIRDFVFHKGCFTITDPIDNDFGCDSEVLLEIDSEKRLNVMRNHTAVHLLNAAVRRVLPDSVVCQTGSSVTDKGLSLNLSVYGQRLTQDVMMRAQDLIRESIRANTPVESHVIDSLQLNESILTVPGESYPETGLRVVEASEPLPSKELCCGTHVPSTCHIGELCITLVKAAGGTSPNIHAITGPRATEARELFCKSHQLFKVSDLLDPEQSKQEVTDIKRRLSELCAGSGAPYAEYSQCLEVLDRVQKTVATNDLALHSIVEEEIRDATDEATRDGRRYVVHFLRCSYIMAPGAATTALRSHRAASSPTLLLGCAQGIITAVCTVPKDMTSPSFNATQWLSSILPVFNAELVPTPDAASNVYAEMTGTKVSLITCEQLVQDAMRAAIKFANTHSTAGDSSSKVASAN
ncbi:alanine--tRNA ligase, mitochondrial [Cydia pomonella]|uniref:alanine--tRNA ligase, mitochondrial n=1 Tax=Cydia pomonella TaxID=82600 RepID=UPI002ADDF5D2|nr:alanine--tRNA ligase, mitochondrial [Cydia pomonella]